MISPPDPADVRAIRNVYAQIPDLHCKGLCTSSCRTRIDMSTVEQARVEGVAGRKLPEWMSRVEGVVCPLLHDGRCSVYGVRPTVCRLWGAAESMPCPHGCTPDGGRLFSDEESIGLLLQAMEIGTRWTSEEVEAAREWMASDPALRELMARVLRGDVTARAEMAEARRRRRWAFRPQ